MIGRTQLAALDDNRNVGRSQATTKKGKFRYRTEFTKQKGAWVAKKIYENKDYEHLHDMLHNPADAAAGDDQLPDTHTVVLLPNLTGEQPPPKKDIIV